ncbi:hypothetical protein [Clostridium sp.]|uniref:hypothetical protein n=1 Tax=Clostridium sp. TaxID=1506 RepID=UPI00262C0894|nr:hypothetical protein [Clostridium sp.]
MSDKIRKVFLDELPKRGKLINWKKSVGYKVKFTYEDIEGEVEIIKCEGNILHIKYMGTEVFEIFTASLKKCQLGGLLGKITNKFKVEIGQVFKEDKRDLTIIDKKYIKDKNNNQNKKWYKYKCNVCGYDEGWIDESSLLTKQIGCSVCANRTVIEGINDIPTTAPWMVNYFQGGYNEAKLYTCCSGQKIIPICPDCGRVKDKKITISNIYQTKSIGCSCGDGQSYPNKFMYSLLEQLEIEFLTEYSPKWIKPKRYDFYFKLNNKEYIIEMDGGWHNKDNNKSGQTKEASKGIDDCKDKLAEEHNIEIIRINCDYNYMNNRFKYIKNNIINKLHDIFDLSMINWGKVEEFALSNLIKKVCDYKKNNPDLTTRQIGEVIKLDKKTIREYLKQGTKLNWCEYDADEEKLKNDKKVRKRCSEANKIKVICMNNNKIFNSIKEAMEYYKIKSNHITDCCKGYRKYCGICPITKKNLTWMYYNEFLKLNN